MTVTQVHYQGNSMVDIYRAAPPTAFTDPHLADTAPFTQSQTQQFTKTSPQPSSSLHPSNSHSRTRTTSSGVLPFGEPRPAPQPPLQQGQQRGQQQSLVNNARRASSATFATSTSNDNMNMQRQGTNSSAASAPRRSTSSRSSSSPTSYVALMRKQKATVWCDRSQNIDQKTAAAQKAAKQRAVMEVHGGTNGAGRTSTIGAGSMVGKIRHHGVPKAPGYVAANLSGAGVPLRLSANEMLGDEHDGKSIDSNSMMHARSGSGRSSTNSAKYPSGYPRSSQGRFSTASTPPSGGEGGSPNIPEDAETPGAEKRGHDYFDEKVGNGTSAGSSQTEGEDSFGGVGELKGPNAAVQAASKAKNADDLRRRGSVDERAMSLGTGVRLFVANPDLDD